MILDAGFLISVVRGEDSAQTLLATRGLDPSLHTTHPVLAQVWRDGAQGAPLALSPLRAGVARVRNTAVAGTAGAACMTSSLGGSGASYEGAGGGGGALAFGALNVRKQRR